MEKICLCILPLFLLGFSKTIFPPAVNILLFILLHIINRNPLYIVKKFTLGILLFSAISSIALLYDYGISSCLLLVIKTVSGGMTLSFFILTTPLEDLLYLASKNKFFLEICDIIKIMERFILLIEDEQNLLYRSLKARNGFTTLSLATKNMGKLAGSLFTNTMRRWKEIKQGLHSRCYNGTLYYTPKDFSFSKYRLGSLLLYNILLLLFMYHYQ